MRENTNQKNSEYGPFSRSDGCFGALQKILKDIFKSNIFIWDRQNHYLPALKFYIFKIFIYYVEKS